MSFYMNFGIICEGDQVDSYYKKKMRDIRRKDLENDKQNIRANKKLDDIGIDLDSDNEKTRKKAESYNQLSAFFPI